MALYAISSLSLHPGRRRILSAGDSYLFLLISRGRCSVTLDARRHVCDASDMLLLKPGVTQTLSGEGQSAPCLITALSVQPETLSRFSDAQCDLPEKYRFVPYQAAIVHGEVNAVVLLKNIVSRLGHLEQEELQLGLSIYESSLLSAFLVLFLRACAQSDQVRRARRRKRLLIDDVFRYLREHLTEDLSLATLEREFHVSGEYLTKRFKASTGLSIHAYVVQSRIDLSKKNILEGVPINEVYALCGFGSYNHFFKAFKAACGVSPKTYYRQQTDIVHRL